MEEPKSKAKRGAKIAAAAQEDKITLLPLSELHDFPNHPFKVRDDEAMQETTESIRQYGVLVPAIVRPREDGGYEIIAGHRRRHGSELAGLSAMPCIVREMDDDTATILMVDSNIQRENILPSERAQAYKMKLEAIRRKAGRPAKAEEIDTSENGGQNGHDLRGIKSRELLAENSDDSARTIQRYIRLTELTPELQQMVDEKKIGMTPAVEISYLKPEEQQMLLTAIDSEQATPSLSQAQRMKKLSRDGKLNDDTMLDIMMEQKKPEGYGMIDGIINNGPKQPTVADLEAQVKAGFSISLTELAAASHREQKKPSVLEKLREKTPEQSKNKTAPKRSAEREL